MNRINFCTVVLGVWAVSLVPASAASIVNVVETGGDNEPTDTITAKWTGTTWPVSVANEPIPGVVVGDNYTVGLFQDLAPAFVDRNHRYYNDASLAIPAYLIGNEYIMTGNDNRDNATYKLDVTVSSAVTVYMLIDNRLSDGNNADPPTFGAANMQWILDQGWAATANGLNRMASSSIPDELAFDEGADNTINQYYSVYSKDFPAGTFSLLQADNGGRNMYGVVIKTAGPPQKAGDVDLDGDVDNDDFDIIRTHFRESGANIGRTQGDLSGDKKVDFTDFALWKSAKEGAPASPVPEPASQYLAAVALLALLGNLRRRVQAARP